MAATPRVALFIDGANLYATSKQLGFDMDAIQNALEEAKEEGKVKREGDFARQRPARLRKLRADD